MAEHTPTPWKLEVDFHETWSEGRVQEISIETDTRVIASYKTNFIEYPMTDEENAANAAFIVKAVNNHEALVNALHVLVEKHGGLGVSPEIVQAKTVLQAVVGQAQVSGSDQ